MPAGFCIAVELEAELLLDVPLGLDFEPEGLVEDALPVVVPVALLSFTVFVLTSQHCDADAPLDFEPELGLEPVPCALTWATNANTAAPDSAAKISFLILDSWRLDTGDHAGATPIAVAATCSWVL